MNLRTPFLATAALCLTALASPVSGAPSEPPTHGGDRYIVVLRDGADPDAVARRHERAHGADIGFVYRHALNGYSAVIPAARLAAVRADDRVAYVEPDGVATVVAQTVPWGIAKVGADVSSASAGDGSGAVGGVNVYVIDTGVDKHVDLQVVHHVNFAGGPNKDCNGHGTHVAGTAVAKDNDTDVVGVAPGAPVTGVKVLGCGGSGSWSGVIKGIDWVTANARKPAVANMSLGGGFSQAVNDAVVRSATSGVFYSLAAGNDGADACDSSPASAGAGTDNGIMTVAATDAADQETSWSNYGPCVDIWAPGANILSTKKGGGTTTMSGTSMASPHGAGGGALYLSTRPSTTPGEVEAALVGASQPAVPATTSKDGVAIHRLYVGGF